MTIRLIQCVRLLILVASCPLLIGADRPHGMDRRPEAQPYLGLPEEEGASPPSLLSRTGVFGDLRALTPSAAMIPYDLIVPFWSDGAEKSRWVAIPHDRARGGAKVRIAFNGAWVFPAGTVFVKHFELPTDETRREPRRRLETRLLVRDRNGGVFGLSYRWKEDQSDAELVPTGRVESVPIQTASGKRLQKWYYPGPADCRQCHTPASGGVLGVRTCQLNRDFVYPSGVSDNQLRAWSHIGLIEPVPTDAEIARAARLARADDPGRSIEDRARSYLDVNCAPCHQPGGVVADFDARYETPLTQQHLIDVPARINLGIDGARMIASNDPWRSMVLARLTTLEPTKMPPLAHEDIDLRGNELLRAWIHSLSGPSVLAPPTIRPVGGDYGQPIRVILGHPDASVTIRYTRDGTAPGKSSLVYAAPLEVHASTTVRARAYRPGWARSIVAQETFIIDP